MIITPCKQPAGYPKGKPLIVDPVYAELIIPLFYTGWPWLHPFLCSCTFARTVLQSMEDILLSVGCGLDHLGCYVARKARDRHGNELVPERWSNHAYGEAMDWRGITRNGIAITVNEMKEKETALLDKVINGVTEAITKTGRKPEIVDEGGWIHVGLWPRKEMGVTWKQKTSLLS